MIVPTVGRIVWFYDFDAGRHIGPLAAIVTAVIDDRTVNLAVFDAHGLGRPAQNVRLVQEGEEVPASAYCCWMPYQIGQAARNEALERKLHEAESAGEALNT